MRNYKLDILKLILSIFVVGIHCRQFNITDKPTLFFLTEGLFRLAVPIFYLVNGYFFYNVVERGFDEVKKRVFQIGRMYLLWMLIYAPFWLRGNWLDSLNSFLYGYNHLWYVLGLFLSTSMTYLVRYNKNMLYISILLFFLGLVLQYENNYDLPITNYLFLPIEINTNSYRNAIFFSFPFFYLGYCTKKLEGYVRNVDVKSRIFLLIFFFFLFILEIYLNYTFLKSLKTFDILITLYPLAFCLFVEFIFFGVTHHDNVFLSDISSSIYFVHPFIIAIVNKLLGWPGYSLKYVLTLIITFLLSILLLKYSKYKKVFLN